MNHRKAIITLVPVLKNPENHLGFMKQDRFLSGGFQIFVSLQSPLVICFLRIRMSSVLSADPVRELLCR